MTKKQAMTFIAKHGGRDIEVGFMPSKTYMGLAMRNGHKRILLSIRLLNRYNRWPYAKQAVLLHEIGHLSVHRDTTYRSARNEFAATRWAYRYAKRKGYTGFANAILTMMVFDKKVYAKSKSAKMYYYAALHFLRWIGGRK